mgnify:CR=1 FL=1
MKILLSITLLTFSLISSAQHALGNYAPGGYYDQIELKKKAEQDLATKMYLKTIKAKERLAHGKSLSKSEQEALDWTEAQINKRKSDSIKKIDDKLAINLEKEKLKLDRKISTLNRLVEEYGTIYVTSDSYNYDWTKEDEEYLTPENKEKMATYNAKIAKEKNEKKKFNISFVENFKIKYKDHVIKCYKENKDYILYSTDIKTEYLKEYEKALGYNYSAGYDYPDENIREVMIEIIEDFKNSKEYKDGEARKDSRMREGISELNKAQKQYNYNMTHLEKYSTPELRKMYIYFSDKKSFQTEAELVRIELLKRK